jgi:hypothetical protein
MSALSFSHVCLDNDVLVLPDVGTDDQRNQRSRRHSICRIFSPRRHRGIRPGSYRFNRRSRHDGLDEYLIRRAVECATITYRNSCSCSVVRGPATPWKPEPL